MALKRRFGARETRAGNWKALAATILGSEIIVPDDSEADRELDVSFVSSFNGYKKSRSHSTSPGSLWQRRPGFTLDQADISAVQKVIHIKIFSEVRARYRLA